jgi:hypothetical protein
LRLDRCDYASSGSASISSSARAWVGVGCVSCSKLAPVSRRRIVFRTRVESSVSRVASEWQGSPAVVRLGWVLRLAAAERLALAPGSGRVGGCSSSNSSGFAWRRC